VQKPLRLAPPISPHARRTRSLCSSGRTSLRTKLASTTTKEEGSVSLALAPELPGIMALESGSYISAFSPQPMQLLRGRRQGTRTKSLSHPIGLH